MKILMLSDVYFPRVNGVSTSIRTFCRELVAAGHEVAIVAPDYGGSDKADEFEVVRLRVAAHRLRSRGPPDQGRGLARRAAATWPNGTGT